jgi:hypothetical protein
MNDTHVLDHSMVGDLGRVRKPIRDSKAEGREESLSVPDRSLKQRMDALERANKIRTTRKDLKLDLKTGRAQITGLILNPPEDIQTMKLFDLLISVPKYGRVKVNRILNQCRISPSKTIGGLSERQRGEIVSYLRRR